MKRQSLTEYVYEGISKDNISNLSESQKEIYKSFIDDLNRSFDEGGVEGCNAFLEKCKDESLYEGILGGVAGFLVGPNIGKIVANALGVKSGLLYDLLTSRLVSAAIGTAIQKQLSGKPF